MLAYQADERPSAAEVAADPWLNQVEDVISSVLVEPLT